MLNLALPEELESIVQERVSTGLYGSPVEVIREALHLIEERDRLVETQREALRRDLQAGIDQLDAGEFVTPTAEEIKNRVDDRLRREA